MQQAKLRDKAKGQAQEINNRVSPGTLQVPQGVSKCFHASVAIYYLFILFLFSFFLYPEA